MIFSISYDLDSQKATYKQDRDLLISLIEGLGDHYKPTDTYYLVNANTNSADSIYKFFEKNCDGEIWEALFIVKLTTPFRGSNIPQNVKKWLRDNGVGEG